MSNTELIVLDVNHVLMELGIMRDWRVIRDVHAVKEIVTDARILSEQTFSDT